jgi:hypothetical protein
LEQAIGDEFVEARNDDSDAKALRAQVTGQRFAPDILVDALFCVPASLW